LTRQNKLIILAIYLLVLAVALPLYRMKRSSAQKRLQAEIFSTRNELDKITEAEREMVKLRTFFPLNANSASFVEDLYIAAQQSKLASHTASSEYTATTSRPSTRSTGSANDLNKYRFKINVEGNYRSIAEYIRRVQNIERFKHFTEIKLIPGKQGVTGTLTLELFSLKGQNAN